MRKRLICCRFGLLGSVLSFVIFFASCGESGPLLGTWADRQANTLTFFEDNKFNARISGQNYSGRYTLLYNALTLDCKTKVQADQESESENESGIDLRIVTEWDIRGNILYLDWTTVDGNTLHLTLFKVSN